MTEDSDGTPRRLARAQEGRIITGVCAGLGRYTRIDPVVYRVMFAVLVLSTGIGIFLYIGAYLLMADPDGGASKIESIRRRSFDGDTVLALLGAALAVGTVLGMFGDLKSPNGLAVAVVFALTLLVARSRGVDLVQIARSLPERVKGHPLPTATPAPRPMTEDMVDLARLGTPAAPLVADHGLAPSGPAADPSSAQPRAPTVEIHIAPPDESAPPRTPARAGLRLVLALLTPLLALAAAVALYIVTAGRPELDRVRFAILGAAVAIEVGVLVSARFHRLRKLVIVGAIMSLALASVSIVGEPTVAGRAHRQTWRPVQAAQAEQTHKVFFGQGTIDLTAVPVRPGTRLRVTAQVTMGELDVRVPGTVRVEVDGQAYLGDITVDRRVTSGPWARVRRVLAPEVPVTGAVPVIELRLRSKVGDIVVTRAPA